VPIAQCKAVKAAKELSLKLSWTALSTIAVEIGECWERIQNVLQEATTMAV